MRSSRSTRRRGRHITEALLDRFRAGVQTRLIIEPAEYLNSKWPEFWLTHANLDKLWAGPFGAIDTPSQGQTVQGNLVNFGWVLTPDTGDATATGDIAIPSSGSTVRVFLDGVDVGQVVFDQCRGNVGNPVPAGIFCNDDVSNIFGSASPRPVLEPRGSNPSRFRNLDAGRGAIGSFVLDTTRLANGLHTIAWSVTDSAGRREGVGSRFFHVLNPGGLR